MNSRGDHDEHERYGHVVDERDPHGSQKVQVDNVKFPDQVFHSCAGIF